MCPLEENRNQRRKTEINAYYVRLFFVVKKLSYSLRQKYITDFRVKEIFRATG